MPSYRPLSPREWVSQIGHLKGIVCKHNNPNPFHLAGTEQFDPFLFLEIRSKQLKESCASGIERCHCGFKNGTYVSGSTLFYEEDPLGAALTYIACNPDFCYCKDAPDVEVDTRPPEMVAVMDVCPRGMMNRCLCHDNKVAKFPFDMTTFLFECRPKKVRSYLFITGEYYVLKFSPN